MKCMFGKYINVLNMQTFVKLSSSVTCMYGDIRMVVFLSSIIWWNISPISLDITDTMVDYYAPRLQYTGYSNLNKYARWKATHYFKNQKQYKMVVNVWNHTKNHDILRHSSLCNHSSYTGPAILWNCADDWIIEIKILCLWWMIAMCFSSKMYTFSYV